MNPCTEDIFKPLLFELETPLINMTIFAAPCHTDMKGHSGMVLTLGYFGFPILYKSQKQKVVTHSSTEVELVCMYSGVDLALCYRRIGQFMGIPDKAPLPVYQDNTSSMKIATMGHGSSTSNTKFMDLKFQ